LGLADDASNFALGSDSSRAERFGECASGFGDGERAFKAHDVAETGEPLQRAQPVRRDT
jgi:hypothetical protein